MKPSIFNRRNLSLVLLLLTGIFVLFWVSQLADSKSQQTFSDPSCPPMDLSLEISEVCPANPGTLAGNSTIYEDYIELYNPSDEAISLEGFYLWDDIHELYEHPLPSHISIEAGEYLLIYAVKDRKDAPANALNVPFQLSSWETLTLGYCDDSARYVVDMVQIPDLDPGTVYARTEQMENDFAPMYPSPGLPNHNAPLALESPVFSRESGFYEDSLLLAMVGPENASLYYTLDGSTPNQSSLLYTEPILLSDPSTQENLYASREDFTVGTTPSYLPPLEPVDKAVVVRAIAIDSQGNYSIPTTATYFLDFDHKDGYENTAILSLTTDPALFFDDTLGIYVPGASYKEALEQGIVTEQTDWITLREYTNYFQRGPETERKVHLEMFASDGQLTLSQDCGVRIHGNESRSFPQKSFTLFARSRYGDSTFPPVFFDSEISYSSLILNGAQKLSKVFIFSLVEDRQAIAQRYMPCQVFLNGEYWGMYYLMEKYSADMLKEAYHVDPERTLLIKNSQEVQDGEEKDFLRFETLLKNLETWDLSDPSAYQDIAEQLDIQNYIDWLCINIFIANTDTLPLGRNVFTWQSLPGSSPSLYGDGRWRWMLYDVDDSMGVRETRALEPAFFHNSIVDFCDTPPTCYLLKNEDFRRQFTLTLLDMANETFEPERVSQLLDSLLVSWKPLSQAQEARWNQNEGELPMKEQAEIIRFFFRERQDVIRTQMADYLDLQGELFTLSLTQEDPKKGTIHLNTLSPDLSHGSWQGQYYADYPITLQAEPSLGHHFAGWEISGASILEGSPSEENIQLLLESENVEVKAVFR
ncbi:MAG: hypothetical protein HFI33_13145 [Lachnospiraceae bacterium]|nr:hypothetical protein [Lachnospiraceae bacterium]